MRWGERLELDPAEGGLYVYPNDLLVALPASLAHGIAYGVVKPPIEVVVERKIVGVEGESAFPVRESLGQLRGDFLPGLAVEGIALAASGRVYRVLGAPEPVFASVGGGLSDSLFGSLRR